MFQYDNLSKERNAFYLDIINVLDVAVTVQIKYFYVSFVLFLNLQ
ncbi:hypothetical protein [Methanobrevibacter ruminantium]|nr:hypothetical protein [Methanobrevibacter ruminantium]